MKLYRQLSYVFCGCLMTAVYSPLASALDNDAEQPITIDSNSATFDDRKGISTYTGNVVAIQGSMQMNSQKLVVYLKEGEVSKLVATGDPARFKQLPAEGEEEIKGKSLEAEYYPDKALLVLIKEAVVWQGENTYASEIIQYDSKNALVKAGEQSSDSKRVRVTLKPKAKKKPQNGQVSNEATEEEIQ